MRQSTALLVSGDSSLIVSCQQVVNGIASLRLEVTNQCAEAEARLQREDLSILLVHLTPGIIGREIVRLLHLLADEKRPIPTLVIGEDQCGEQGLQLLRHGAADYLSRPLDLSRFAYLVDTLTVRPRYVLGLVKQAPETVVRIGEQEPFFYIPDAAMGQVMEKIQLVAPQDTTILLGGETGTGKTRLARLIHEQSSRRGEPFRTVHCGALAANLIESEMFGHVKGAFTSADRDRVGKFAEVGRGTLLLDEIDCLPPSVQIKLLRAVEERIFEPVGSNKALPLQARLIVASNQPLATEVKAGRFRADLYYRLNVVGFFLPPLRERRRLIPHLVTNFIAEFAARNARPITGISAKALCALENYSWPGNIRELRNVIESAVALTCRSVIELGDLPEPLAGVSSPAELALRNQPIQAPGVKADPTLEGARGRAELSRILESLDKHSNNRLRVAAELGISRMTLYNKLRKYGLLEA